MYNNKIIGEGSNKECISYTNDDSVLASKSFIDEKESIDLVLLNCYRQSKTISLIYRDKGKILNYTGTIDRIDLIYRVLFLVPKKKISFGMIVGINITN